MKRTSCMAIALAAALAVAHGAASTAQDADDTEPEHHVRGWLELARVQPVNLLIRAKLDSGAKTTAIHADILRGPAGYDFPEELDEEADIDDTDVAADAANADEGDGDADADDAERADTGPDTIVFALESRAGRRVVFEREVIRWVNIKNRSGGTTSRPVVTMAFCVGGVRMEGEVGLTDRGDFNYPLLIGRTMMTDANVVVDPGATFTYRSRCYRDGPRKND